VFSAHVMYAQYNKRVHFCINMIAILP